MYIYLTRIGAGSIFVLKIIEQTAGEFGLVEHRPEPVKVSKEERSIALQVVVNHHGGQ